jgi:16S rRNA C967 or C1407 C5-methylase (RsmB/RsmF family)|tara:strand:- start:440 stop:637 length:198 start_codon:yes stop_codon:yes gene_type:complete
MEGKQMIPAMVIKAVLPKVVKLVAKQFKLDKMERIIKYMDEPNDADIRIDELEKKVSKLEKLIKE